MLYTAAFYCFQHAGMEQRPRRARKRSFGDKDLLNKLAPVLGPQKKPQLSPNGKFLSPAGGVNSVDGRQVRRAIMQNIYLTFYTTRTHIVCDLIQ